MTDEIHTEPVHGFDSTDDIPIRCLRCDATVRFGDCVEFASCFFCSIECAGACERELWEQKMTHKIHTSCESRWDFEIDGPMCEACRDALGLMDYYGGAGDW